MNAKVVQNALSFLGRVDLKGAEALAFIEVVSWLRSLRFEDAPKPAEEADSGDVEGAK